jgi:uncharacterized membrane protein
MTKALTERGINLNTLLLAISILGAITTAVLFIAPLKTLPHAQERIQNDVHEMKRTQAVQTEALKTLAEVARESRDLRREFDHHSASSTAGDRARDQELQAIRHRLDRLESR